MLIRLGAHELVLDPLGALVWPARRLLVVADLHLGKAQALARRGALLPPHDTALTLERLQAVLDRHAPETVVSLGDGFHDPTVAGELDPAAFDRLARMVRARRWLWVRGNHDPGLPLALGGACLEALEVAGVVLRHAPAPGAVREIAGHLHPKARLPTRHRRLVRPCFVGDGRRLLLPAFGAFTGGLDVLDPAIALLFPAGFTAWLTGESRIFAVPSDRLAAAPASARRRA